MKDEGTAVSVLFILHPSSFRRALPPVEVWGRLSGHKSSPRTDGGAGRPAKEKSCQSSRKENLSVTESSAQVGLPVRGGRRRRAHAARGQGRRSRRHDEGGPPRPAGLHRHDRGV